MDIQAISFCMLRLSEDGVRSIIMDQSTTLKGSLIISKRFSVPDRQRCSINQFLIGKE